jgi:sec-independent protein translocase protein TatB
MEILGIGPLELLLIVFVILIVLGPKDLVKTTKTLGQGLNKLVKSDLWRDIRQTSEKVKNLPTELMREAELEEIQKSLQEPLNGLSDLQKTLQEPLDSQPKIAPFQEPRIIPSPGPVIVPEPEQIVAPAPEQDKAPPK